MSSAVPLCLVSYNCNWTSICNYSNLCNTDMLLPDCCRNSDFYPTTVEIRKGNREDE